MNDQIIDNPRDAGAFIAKIGKHVTIIDEGIDKAVIEAMNRIEDGRLSLDAKSFKPAGTIMKADVDWVFMTSALNFSFWILENEPQYLVTYKEVTYNGYMSMLAAITRTLDDGIPLTSPQFYGSITKEKLNEYLIGDKNIPCPMIEERVKCLHEIADVLTKKYNGSFENCLKECKNSAAELLKIVVNEFKCFDDSHLYQGKRVAIHKRAQILVADLWQLFEGKGICQFNDIDCITMFADYRVPQSLQYFGAFSYSLELMEILSKNQILKSGDPFEVEIRGCSIEAVTRIVNRVNEKLKHSAKTINDIQIDNFLWGFRREKSTEMEQYPYHRVRSIFY